MTKQQLNMYSTCTEYSVMYVHALATLNTAICLDRLPHGGTGEPEGQVCQEAWQDDLKVHFQCQFHHRQPSAKPIKIIKHSRHGHTKIWQPTVGKTVGMAVNGCFVADLPQNFMRTHPATSHGTPPAMATPWRRRGGSALRF